MTWFPPATQSMWMGKSFPLSYCILTAESFPRHQNTLIIASGYSQWHGSIMENTTDWLYRSRLLDQFLYNQPCPCMDRISGDPCWWHQQHLTSSGIMLHVTHDDSRRCWWNTSGPVIRAPSLPISIGTWTTSLPFSMSAIWASVCM